MKRLKLLNVLLFIILITLPMLLWAELRYIMPEYYAEYSKDLGEKRNKAVIEDYHALLFSGDQLDDYVNDRVPFRSLIIETHQKISAYEETPYEDKVRPVLTRIFVGGGQNPEVNDDPQTKVVDTGALDFLGDTSASASTEPEPIIEPEPDPPIDDECVHDWEVVEVVESTCQTAGYGVYTCVLCGEEHREELAKAEHYPVLLNHLDADYTTWGRDEYICAYCGIRWNENYVSKLIDTSYLAPVTSQKTVLYGRYGWMFYVGYTAYDYYKGTNLPEKKELEAYVNAFADLQDICDRRGIKLCIMIPPNKEEVYSEYMPTVKVSDSYKRIDRIIDYVAEKTDISILYPLKELQAADMNGQVYRKYDSHWNNMGAFIGTQALYSQLGLEVTNPMSVKTTTFGRHDGDLILLAGLGATEFPDEVEYNIDYRPDVEPYVCTPGAYNQEFYISTCENPLFDGNFVLIGDSYREAMAPFLEKDFRITTLAHRNSTDAVTEYIKCADILVVEAIGRDEEQLIESAKKITIILEEAEAEEQ